MSPNRLAPVEGEFFSLLATSGMGGYECFRRSMTARLTQIEQDMYAMAIAALTDPSKQPLALRLQGRWEEMRELIDLADLYKPKGV